MKRFLVIWEEKYMDGKIEHESVWYSNSDDVISEVLESFDPFDAKKIIWMKVFPISETPIEEFHG